MGRGIDATFFCEHISCGGELLVAADIPLLDERGHVLSGGGRGLPVQGVHLEDFCAVQKAVRFQEMPAAQGNQ